jgi:hypothetical protein
MENKKKNILFDKYKTYDLLAISMLFMGVYSLIIAFIVNRLVLFLTSTATEMPFNLSIFFFFVLMIAHIPLVFLNRQIDCKKEVIQNIRKINILYLSIIYIRIIFCIIIIPLQFILMLLLLKEILQIYFHLAIIICCVCSAFSITAGLFIYIKKRNYIQFLRKELSELD